MTKTSEDHVFYNAQFSIWKTEHTEHLVETMMFLRSLGLNSAELITIRNFLHELHGFTLTGLSKEVMSRKIYELHDFSYREKVHCKHKKPPKACSECAFDIFQDVMKMNVYEMNNFIAKDDQLMA